jgi:hypothetical protein
MSASSLRMYAAAAAVPASLVVLGHLAYVWHRHADVADRQSAAFAHGIALASILAAVLVAGRAAQWIEGSAPHFWGEAIGVIGTIAVLAHLADAWRAGYSAISSIHVLWVHLAALAATAAAVVLVRRAERGRARRVPAA